jgi:hypothetical protein
MLMLPALPGSPHSADVAWFASSDLTCPHTPFTSFDSYLQSRPLVIRVPAACVRASTTKKSVHKTGLDARARAWLVAHALF